MSFFPEEERVFFVGVSACRALLKRKSGKLEPPILSSGGAGSAKGSQRLFRLKRRFHDSTASP